MCIKNEGDYKNLGEECWKYCGDKEGSCSWCGTRGQCCRKGWTGNGCNGVEGGDNVHMCTQATIPPPPKSQPCTNSWPETVPNCTKGGQTCIFPFTYEGVTYNECATDDKGNRWCSINVDGNLKHISGYNNVGWCPRECNTANLPSTDCSADKATYCGLSKSNTMCRYCGLNVDKCNAAAGICNRGFDRQEDKDAILDVHNQLRRKVALGEETKGVGGIPQPGASNMYKLKWSNELAEVAQRWADQCTFPHDDVRNTSTYSWVGQNAWAWSSGYPRDGSRTNTQPRIEQLYNEVKDWPAGSVESFAYPGKSTGEIRHYTQIVWAETKEVGCGTITVRAGGAWMYNWYLFCNYGPGGNVPGASVYDTNTTAPCPSGSVEEDGLCVW